MRMLSDGAYIPMQMSSMWGQFSLADLRDLPGDPEVRSHYKRARARWLHVI